MKGGRRTRFKHYKLNGWLHNFKKNTKDDIITATSKSGMHIRADKNKKHSSDADLSE